MENNNKIKYNTHSYSIMEELNNETTTEDVESINTNESQNMYECVETLVVEYFENIDIEEIKEKDILNYINILKRIRNLQSHVHFNKNDENIMNFFSIFIFSSTSIIDIP